MSGIPAFILSGDTHRFEVGYTDYPATDWTASFYLVGHTNISVTAVASGSDFAFTIPATKTATLPEGTYTYVVKCTSGDEVYTVETDLINVKENVAAKSTRIQHAEKMLKYIEAAMENRLSDGDAIEAMSIAGRNLSFMSLDELLTLRAHYISELRSLQNRSTNPGGMTSIRLNVGRINV